MTPGLLALLGAVFGGAGLKLIEKWLNRSKEREDVATQIRKELRDEVVSLRTELNNVEKQLDEWKDRYYKLKEEFLVIRGELQFALDRVKEAAEATQAHLPPQQGVDRNPHDM